MKTDRHIRRLAIRLSRLSGDEALAKLVWFAILQMEAGRVWRSPRWQPMTEAEREAQAKAPPVMSFELRDGDPVPPRYVPADELTEWIERIGPDRITGWRVPGLSIDRIDPDDRRDTLSDEEMRELRVEKWGRVWRHLAGIPTPAMGWLGFETGTRYVFLYSDSRQTRARWKTMWATLEANPRAILGPGASLALLSALHPRGFGMAIAEPGTARGDLISALASWTGTDMLGKPPRRIRAEVRMQATGKLLWSAAAPLSERDALAAHAVCEVASYLPSRPKDRIETHPDHLVCWLLKNGHGRLTERGPGRIARALLGVSRSAPRHVVVASNKTVRDHIRAAEKLIARHHVKT